MSVFQRDRYLKKLRRLLSSAKDEEFIKLLWAVDALQNGRREAASPYIEFPEEAVTTSLADKLAIYPWELETLFGQRLALPHWTEQEGKNRTLNCAQFNSLSTVVHFLRKLENAESAIYLKRIHILSEMHRIGHRQFGWQRGFLNGPQFYRYAFIYNQGQCAAYFRSSYGISLDDFSKVGFAFAAAFRNHPVLDRPVEATELGITNEIFDAALKIISLSVDEAREQLARLIESLKAARLGVAYQPSLARRFPLVEFDDGKRRLLAPIPEIIFARITSGIYYDIVPGGQPLLNEASERFEAYSAKFMTAMLSTFSVGRSTKYQSDGANFETPDVLAQREDAQIVVECKATKLTYPAQFNEDPLVSAKRGYDEIVKAVFQIWRFFSHLRRGAFPVMHPKAQLHGVVLTLDAWLMMSRELRAEIVKAAHDLADKDGNITAADRMSVVFCSIEDLEAVFCEASETEFLDTLTNAADEKYAGWILPNVFRDLGKEPTGMKPYPFEIGEVLSWWSHRPALKADA